MLRSASGLAFSEGRVLGGAGLTMIDALAATTGSYPLAISLLSLIYIVGLPFVALAAGNRQSAAGEVASGRSRQSTGEKK